MAIARIIVMICRVRRQRLFYGLGWRIENRSNNNYNNSDASIPLASGGRESGANSNNIFGRHARIAGANDDNNVDSPLGGIFAPPTSVAAAANDGKTSSTIALQWRAGLQRSAPLSHQGWIDLRMRLELP